GTSSNPFQYTGRENDATGLFHYRARYYNPAMQRFISEDPNSSPLFEAKRCKGNFAIDPANYVEIDPATARLMVFRFYSAVSGAIGLNPQKGHLYTYADNNPMSKFD